MPDETPPPPALLPVGPQYRYVHVTCGRKSFARLAVAAQMTATPQQFKTLWCESCCANFPRAEFTWENGNPIGYVQ